MPSKEAIEIAQKWFDENVKDSQLHLLFREGTVNHVATGYDLALEQAEKELRKYYEQIVTIIELKPLLYDSMNQGYIYCIPKLEYLASREIQKVIMALIFKIAIQEYNDVKRKYNTKS